MAANIEYEFCELEDLLIVLTEVVGNHFPQVIFEKSNLEVKVAEYMDIFRDGLHFVIEYPYVDKFYRDSYYHYFASKHGVYQRDCIRISIFGKEIAIEDFLKNNRKKFLQENFLGFFILRPLRQITGRSLISPDAFEEKGFSTCKHTANCSILGVKLQVEGFPHCSQDYETITCSETTLWAVMEYFGNKYPDYKPALPSQIIKALEMRAVQRQLPARGLTMEDLSFALKQFGFGPRLYSKHEYGVFFNDIIDMYVESGIPVLAGLSSDEGDLGHVVLITGKQAPKPDFTGITQRIEEDSDRQIKYHYSSDFIAEYVVQDDNLAPYRLITLDRPGEHYNEGVMQDYEIDQVVVPLYPKVYLEAFVAKKLAFEILKSESLGYQFADSFIFRFFLTSSRSFKQHIVALEEMPEDIHKIILLTKMPKFIWVAEIYAKEHFVGDKSHASGLIVIDATEANEISEHALIFAVYPDRYVAIDQNIFVTLQQGLANYRYFSNLL